MDPWRVPFVGFVLSLLASSALVSSAIAQHNPRADYVPPPAVLTVTPCPPQAQPMLQSTKFLVVNNTAQTLQCRMRHPALGGWSDYSAIAPGGRLIDRKLDVEMLLVHCKPPGRTVAFKAYPGQRYSLVREPGNTDVSLVRVGSAN